MIFSSRILCNSDYEIFSPVQIFTISSGEMLAKLAKRVKIAEIGLEQRDEQIRDMQRLMYNRWLQTGHNLGRLSN